MRYDQYWAADDWLVLANTTITTTESRPQDSWGLNDMIKSSGRIMGGAAAAGAQSRGVRWRERERARV